MRNLYSLGMKKRGKKPGKDFSKFFFRILGVFFFGISIRGFGESIFNGYEARYRRRPRLQGDRREPIGELDRKRSTQSNRNLDTFLLWIRILLRYDSIDVIQNSKVIFCLFF